MPVHQYYNMACRKKGNPLRQAMFHYFLAQVLGRRSTKRGKISSRPASMSRHRTALDRSDSPAKEAAGPTAPRPGPMLLRVARTEEMVVEASKLSRDTKSMEAMAMRM